MRVGRRDLSGLPGLVVVGGCLIFDLAGRIGPLVDASMGVRTLLSFLSDEVPDGCKLPGAARGGANDGYGPLSGENRSKP